MIRLLIADDEKLEREALADMVSRRFEHEVVLELAENGRKAADTAVLWGADLILMDIEMPGMSGLDAARAVLAQRPACRVIFVTAYSLFQYAHEAVHLGACDYLLKPVDPDELEASIRRAMRQIEAERKLEELARTTELSPEPETPEIPENPEEGAPEAESPEGENSQTAMVMTQVRRYLEDNYMFDLSLDSVGEILHISPAYLSAQFKKYQKMNFLDCLTELRINAAKELLAEAGYPDGFSTTLWCSDTQVMRDSAVVIQEQLRQVGINAEVKTLESGQFQSETGNGAHDMFIMSKTSIDPDSMLRSMYHTEALGPSGNRCFWTTPEVDALIDEASTTTDTEHAMELYAEIQGKVAEAAPLVPMAVEHLNAGMQSNVKGFGLYPGKSHYINGTYFE